MDAPTVFLVRPDGYRGALDEVNTFAHYVRRFYTEAQVSKLEPTREAVHA